MSQEQWRSADFFHMSLELPIVVNGGFINLEAILVEIVQNRRLANKPKQKTNKS